MLNLRMTAVRLLESFEVEFAPNEDGSGLVNGTKDHFTIGLPELSLTFKKR